MTSNTLLKMLPPYTGQKATLVNDQNLDDVINGVVTAANSYRSHYTNIWQNFEGDGLKDTCRNVWNFLKKNVDYVIEPDSRQTIKTPSAIIATGKTTGSDCKNYALFSAGIMNAYREATGLDFDVILRFAGYNGRDLQHVFCVVKHEGKEYWIDPVLDKFNDKSQVPTKTKDYKLKNMALIALSGVNPYTNDKSYFVTQSNPVPGSALGADPQKSGFVKFAEKVQKSAPEQSDIAKGANLAINVASGNWAAAGMQLMDTLKGLFAGKDNPQDYWQSWDSIDQQYGNPKGSQVQHWIMFDGDSVANEALNIMSYFSWYLDRNDSQTAYELLLGKNSTTLRDAGRYVTFEDLIDKLKRGGYVSEAKQLEQTYKSLSVKPDAEQKQQLMGGSNMLITLALVGAAAFLLLKKR